MQLEGLQVCNSDSGSFWLKHNIQLFSPHLPQAPGEPCNLLMRPWQWNQQTETQVEGLRSQSPDQNFLLLLTCRSLQLLPRRHWKLFTPADAPILSVVSKIFLILCVLRLEKLNSLDSVASYFCVAETAEPKLVCGIQLLMRKHTICISPSICYYTTRL